MSFDSSDVVLPLSLRPLWPPRRPPHGPSLFEPDASRACVTGCVLEISPTPPASLLPAAQQKSYRLTSASSPSSVGQRQKTAHHCSHTNRPCAWAPSATTVG